MGITAIPVDQRVIDIDSRRFASVEKALVELITNSDDSYSRLERAGVEVTEGITIQYERHQNGAMLVVADQAEGMTWQQALTSLTYGGAHSPLANGDATGRGFFGRGLKQAIYGLGYGWLETLHNGRYTRIDLFRGEDGGYLYDDGEGDREAKDTDYERLGTDANGTRVAIVIDNPLVHISQYRSVLHSISHNIYLREILGRRRVELVHRQAGKEVERMGPVHYLEPESRVLLGPQQACSFVYEQVTYPFTLTLKRALNAELTLHGDERTNGLLVLSGNAVLDCQLFEFENQVGTEYLFGEVNCPSLAEKLGQGLAIISDERDGLNLKDPFVAAFGRAVSKYLRPAVQEEREQLRHLEHATASGRTDHMIEHLLERMNRAAIQDLQIALPPAGDTDAESAPEPEEPALRFTTPFYFRQAGHPFHVSLLVNPASFAPDDVLHISYRFPDSVELDTKPTELPVSQLTDRNRIEWTITGDSVGDRGEITVRSQHYWAWCEVVIADHGAHHRHHRPKHHPRHNHRAASRDHGEAMFIGYDFRALHNELERAVYSPKERKILINTEAPTVQLYVDGRGRFRDSARLLLAELFMDVISDELARHQLARSKESESLAAFHAAKMDIIRRYGSDIHRSFINA
ncbi:ATP-binding protein [Marinobacter sp.]|uniref:ATP-binding protein n=1 Tax=Marinobacter sp. TaxID=50741 RepID=UPI00356176CF